MLSSDTSHAAGRLAMNDWVLLPMWRQQLSTFDEQVFSDLSNAPELLAEVPLAAWAAALLKPEVYFPRSAEFLPRMPSENIQKSWTGSSGAVLLETTLAFIQQVLCAAAEAKLDIKTSQVLDFGVGWGRIARIWLKYLPPDRLNGCDAWDRSLELAKEAKLKNHIVKSHGLLTELPFPENSFEIIYALSIFTHLNEMAFKSCLSGLSKMLVPGGLLVFTVRPSRFWLLRPNLPDSRLLAEGDGFCFRHGSFDPNFGDTTVDFSWITQELQSIGLSFTGMEWSPVDAMQIIIKASKPK